MFVAVLMPDDSTVRKCLICTTPTVSLHHGIDACRACAAFYKRTKITGKRLICRQGDNNCVFRKHEKFMCRKCRYDKCVEQGMNLMADTTLPSDIPSIEYSMLDRIAQAHAVCIGRRRRQELELVRKHNLVRVPHPSEEVYLHNYECIIATAAAALPEHLRFFQAAFPTLRVLPQDYQANLLRMCITPFMMAECMSRTERLFGRTSNYIVSSVLMCSDSQNLDVWGGPLEGQLKSELIGLTRSYIQNQKTQIYPAYENANLSKKEFLALLPAERIGTPSR